MVANTNSKAEFISVLKARMAELTSAQGTRLSKVMLRMEKP